MKSNSKNYRKRIYKKKYNDTKSDNSNKENNTNNFFNSKIKIRKIKLNTPNLQNLLF